MIQISDELKNKLSTSTSIKVKNKIIVTKAHTLTPYLIYTKGKLIAPISLINVNVFTNISFKTLSFFILIILNNSIIFVNLFIINSRYIIKIML